MLGCPQVFRRTVRYHLNRQVARWTAKRSDPAALMFYRAIRDSGLDPDTWIDVLPRQRLIYVSVPKAASTTIRSMLSEIATSSKPPDQRVLYKRRCSGLLSPTMAGLERFHKLATSAGTLRFTFVRNPYARLVSAWSNKFYQKPLLRGDPYVDLYLNYSASSGNKTESVEPLTFPRFVQFVRDSIESGWDPHWDLQVRRTLLPGIELSLIGRVESFEKDIGHVLRHMRRPSVKVPRLNQSISTEWTTFYSEELAKVVYRLYEQDFDTFRYTRGINAA